jgi:hypothetical protein
METMHQIYAGIGSIISTAVDTNKQFVRSAVLGTELKMNTVSIE